MIEILIELKKLLIKDRVKSLLVLLSLFLYILSQHLVLEYLVPEDIGGRLCLFLLQLALVLFWLCICLSALLVLSYYKTFKATPWKPKKLKSLSPVAQKILIFFGHESSVVFTAQELRDHFDLSFNKIQVAIEELLKFNFLNIHKEDWQLAKDPPAYELSPDGRAFLVKLDLL